jgi:hypothetical protein
MYFLHPATSKATSRRRIAIYKSNYDCRSGRQSRKRNIGRRRNIQKLNRKRTMVLANMKIFPNKNPANKGRNGGIWMSTNGRNI